LTKTSIWAAKRRIESGYRRELNKHFENLFKILRSGGEPSAIIEKLKKLAASPEYLKFAGALARKMVTGAYAQNAKTWREAAFQSMRGREIYEALTGSLNGTPMGARVAELVKENAALIKTFPLEISEDITAFVQREQLKGRRASEIAKDLAKEFPDRAKSRIDLIARTEVSKAQTALTRSRAESLGLNWYIWRTSEDGRVRGAHRHMDGVLINWNDPPDPEALIGLPSNGNYHAGDIFNCRCYPEPIVSLDFESFPAKVYYGGTITRVTRAQFDKIN